MRPMKGSPVQKKYFIVANLVAVIFMIFVVTTLYKLYTHSLEIIDSCVANECIINTSN